MQMRAAGNCPSKCVQSILPLFRHAIHHMVSPVLPDVNGSHFAGSVTASTTLPSPIFPDYADIDSVRKAISSQLNS